MTRRVVIIALFVLLSGELWLAYRGLGAELHDGWFAGAVVLLAVLGYGITTHPANARSWPTLLANRHSVFLIASRDTESFLEVPWPYIESFHKGQFGVDTRGIELRIPKARLSESDEQLVRQQLPSVVDRGDALVVAVPSGIRKRDVVVERLRGLRGVSR